MIRLSNLLGQPVVSLADASETGSASGVLIQHGSITAIELDSGGTVSAASVASFDGDVLTYDGPVRTEAGAVYTEEPLDDGPRPSKIRGLRALTTTGVELGEVDDLEITAQGVIDQVILTSGERIAGQRLQVAGTFAAIIEAEPAVP